MRRLAMIVLGLVLTALLGAVAAAEEIPDSLRDIVFGAGHRPIVETTLDGTVFRGLAPFSSFPYLLWPTENAPTTYDHEKAAEWIRRSAAALGHGDFEPRYVGTWQWRDNEVWTYELVRRGIPLFDARVLLHWRDRRLVGLVNDVPLPIRWVEEPGKGKMGPGEHVYAAEREAGAYALRLARVLRESGGDRVRVSVVIGGETIRRIVEPLASRSGAAASLREWAVPLGTFPDQIDIDSTGLVWFSQPWDDWVTSFDPATEVFTQHDTTTSAAPDGLMVDGSDVLWTGLYGMDNGLGEFDIASSTFTAIAAPYLSATMAIPNETSAGTVWVTDHLNNRISEYDPASDTWLQNLIMPTPDCWVTGGTEDTASLDVYFTEYGADQLGRKPLAGPIEEITAPPMSGPAFAVYWNGHVYFSEWNRNRLGDYEISSGVVTEHTFPVVDEQGGPIDVTPGGLIAVGTRNLGYIMIFQPANGTFVAHEIPTGSPGLKDGLRSDGTGRIWFTESSANKIAVLDPGGPATDFWADPTAGVAPLLVDFTDLSTNAPNAWSWDFGDSGTSEEQHPTHLYTDAGLYTVSLTVDTLSGPDTKVKVNYINVIPPCLLGLDDPLIFGEKRALGVAFGWQADPDCLWAVHRATDPVNILSTLPVITLSAPPYNDPYPFQPLLFYKVEPIDNAP